MARCVVYRLRDVPPRYWDVAHRYGAIHQSKPYSEFLASCMLPPDVAVVYAGREIIGGAAVCVGRQVWRLARNAGTHLGPVAVNPDCAADVFSQVVAAVRRRCLTYSILLAPEYADKISRHGQTPGGTRTEVEFLKWRISPPLDVLHVGLARDKKKGIRRAANKGVVFEEIVTAEQVRAFHRLHAMTMARGGMRPSSLRYYQALMARLRPEGMAAGFLALHPETRQPIASRMLLLGNRGEAVALAIGHDYEFRSFHAPDALLWHAVQFLKARGFTMLDLGGLPRGNSPRARGIRRFKLAWVGKNGIHCPSSTLTYGMLGLDAARIENGVSRLRRVPEALLRFVRGG